MSGKDETLFTREETLCDGDKQTVSLLEKNPRQGDKIESGSVLDKKHDMRERMRL